MRRSAAHPLISRRIAIQWGAISVALLSPRAADAQAATPPHAWLFGSWTGGLFPAPSSMTPAACLATPIVVFTRDVVLRQTLTDITYVQRVIETVRVDGNTTVFRFTPTGATQAAGLLGLTAPQPAPGFGCDNDANLLRVQRRGENEISFPGCHEFPNPLVRCPTR